MRKFFAAAVLTLLILCTFSACNNAPAGVLPLPPYWFDKPGEPEHVHTYETVIDATGDTVYEVIRCPECGTEFSRVEFTGTTITGSDGIGYKTLEEAMSAVNSAGEGEYTLTIANGDYTVSPMTLSQTVAGKSVTITAESVGGVTLSSRESASDADKSIFTIDSDSSYQENSPVVIKGINFDLTNVSEGHVLSAVTMGTGSDRYAQNVTIDSCSFIGLNDLSYAVDVNANAGAKNITIINCKADNVRGLYGGYGDNIVIRNCTLTNSKSIINSQSVNSVAAAPDYNIQIVDVTADIKADVPDKIYAIRISGGRTLIEDCDVTMTYRCPENDKDNTVEYGLLVLRDAENEVEIRNSTLTAITDEASPKKAYAIYQEDADKSVKITIDDFSKESVLSGGVYPETLLS